MVTLLCGLFLQSRLPRSCHLRKAYCTVEFIWFAPNHHFRRTQVCLHSLLSQVNHTHMFLLHQWIPSYLGRSTYTKIKIILIFAWTLHSLLFQLSKLALKIFPAVVGIRMAAVGQSSADIVLRIGGISVIGISDDVCRIRSDCADWWTKSGAEIKYGRMVL